MTTQSLKITTDFGPLWDTKNDLDRLRGVLGAIFYLSHPLIEDSELEDVHMLLCCIEEKIGEAHRRLNEAIENGHIGDTEGKAQK